MNSEWTNEWSSMYFPEWKVYIDVAPVNADQSMFITDLNADCLGHIFNELNASNLLNVAQTCKLMEEAARLEIKRKAKNKWVHFTLIFPLPSFFNPDSNYDEGDVLAEIKSMQDCLRFLRCFGHVLSKLYISFNRIDYHFKHNSIAFCLGYLFKYCADSLIEIKIAGAGEYPHKANYARTKYGFKNLNDGRLGCFELKCYKSDNKVGVVLKDLWDKSKPFKNIEKISLYQCFLDTQFIQLNEMFPKVRSVRLRDIREQTHHHLDEDKKWKCIGEQFSNLQNLSVTITTKKYGGFQEDEFLAALKLNTNLQSLHLRLPDRDYKPAFFSRLSEHATSIESLKIDVTFGFWENWNYTNVRDDDYASIYFKSVRSLHIHFSTVLIPLKVPFKFGALENFTLEFNCAFLSDNLIYFLRNNTSVNNIIFYSSHFLADDGTPYVRMCGLENKIALSVEEAISIIHKCRSTTRLFLRLQSYPECTRFKRLMEKEWDISNSTKFLYKDQWFVDCQKRAH